MSTFHITDVHCTAFRPLDFRFNRHSLCRHRCQTGSDRTAIDAGVLAASPWKNKTDGAKTLCVHGFRRPANPNVAVNWKMCEMQKMLNENAQRFGTQNKTFDYCVWTQSVTWRRLRQVSGQNTAHFFTATKYTQRHYDSWS